MPGILCFPAYSVAAVRPSILTVSPFSFSYAHGRYALIGRFLYHVPPVRLDSPYVMLTIMPLDFLRHSLRHDDVSCLDFDVTMTSSYHASLYPDFSSRRFSLRPVLYPVRFPSYHLPDWTLFLSLTFAALTPVCTCSPRTCIYTGLEMGRSPSSIYFATTLVL